jgi:hypothetical protein
MLLLYKFCAGFITPGRNVSSGFAGERLAGALRRENCGPVKDWLRVSAPLEESVEWPLRKWCFTPSSFGCSDVRLKLPSKEFNSLNSKF